MKQIYRKQSVNSFLKKLCILIFISSFSTLGHSLTYPVSLEQRTQQASTIVIGHLVEQQPYLDEASQKIYTLNIIQITAYLKGYQTNDKIGIITPGGTLYDKATVVIPSAKLADYNEYLFFIKNDNLLFDNKTYRAANPNIVQAELYSSVQGAMTKQLGFYNDLHSEPRQTELSLCNKILQWTNTTMTTSEGRPFTPRDGDTRPLSSDNHYRSSSITSFSPNPTHAGTVETSDFITISGAGFGATEDFVYYTNADDGGATFTTNGVSSDNLSWSNTSIQNKPTDQAGTGPIRVNGITSSSNLTVNYAHTALDNTFAGWSESTRNRPLLVNKDNNGGYTFQYNTTFNANSSATAAFERALDTWKNATGVNITISGSTTAISSVASDGVNVILFNSSLPAGTLGRATAHFNATASGSCLQANTVWWINEMDMEFQTVPAGCCSWNYGTAATTITQFDFESVVLHELGHAFGLGHVLAAGEVMHFAISNGSDVRTLSTNDKDGILAKLAYSDDPLCMTPSGVHGPHVPTALPVELMYFTGEATAKGNVLTWETATEENNDYFELEWSEDGIHFQKIATIQGAGTIHDAQLYQFTDAQNFVGLNFYRLKQVDFDEQFEYYKIISIDNQTQPIGLHIFPNPIHSGFINIHLETADAQIILTDNTGKVVSQYQILNRHFKISTDHLANGMYYLQVIQTQYQVIQKIIIQQ